MSFIGVDISSVLKHVWERVLALLTQRPDVTGDMRVYTAKWIRRDSEEQISGIEILVSGWVTLANNGRVGTAIKHVFLELRCEGKERYPLSCFSLYGAFHEEEITVPPLGVWRSGSIEFRGFIPEALGPPKHLECRIIVDAVAQRPSSKKINLPEIVRMTS